MSVEGERITPEQYTVAREQYILFLRHRFAYDFAANTIPKESMVLEVGCGEGYGADLLSHGVGPLICLDVDEKAIAHAREKYGSSDCEFAVYDGVEIPYGENIFDAVVSFQVIEHIEDDLNFVAEIYRVLRPDGIFIVTTPNKTFRLKPGQKPWNKYHKREYYPHELKEVLRSKFSQLKVWGIRGKGEVQLIEVKKARPAPFPLSVLKRMVPESVKLWIIRLREKRVWKKNSPMEENFLERYSLEDFFVIKDKVEESLDLLGICKK